MSYFCEYSQRLHHVVSANKQIFSTMPPSLPRSLACGQNGLSYSQTPNTVLVTPNTEYLQSGASSHAKHGGAYFSVVRGSIKDPIAVPGQDEVQEC